ncbi:hypothetical protein HU200_066072 [Digitaria exilis]|uniref:Uncharacterized protein n=1 Tax=Digitaria exilis TaxID=1010633 RepID=A0A835DU98_9POAL|nr:hypothetical protein HU200_066072 [Digitaria exilis]
MLIHCAQSVATGDRRSAMELLRQIKQHSSPRGDATQRVAHCFAEGLEARIAGTGSQVYHSLVAKRTSLVDYLKAYRMFMAASSLKKAYVMFCNTTILNTVAGRSKLHIVVYGVQYAWVPPAYQIEETGRRLSNCALEFGVPFKFQAIAAKWETVRAEDLNIDPDEVLVVNCECDFNNLMDERCDVDTLSPRDMVLNNIRKMRPNTHEMYFYVMFITVSEAEKASTLTHRAAMASMPDGEGLFVDPEPFSPSIFLDLPPTPRPDGSGQEPASSDDLVLPFISRMLMEEDFNDEFFYQFPNHPTLLQAQEPYAQILYDSTTTTAGSSSSGTNSSASGSAAALSPSSSDDPAQPYPNAGLHDSTAGDVGAFFLPAQDGTILGFEQSPAQLGNVGDVNAFVAGQHGGSTSTQSSASLEDGKASRPEQAAAEGEHGASSVFFSGQNNRVNMDMLNQAFLKGMEEAKKLLPTNNNLLMNPAFATTGGEEEQARGNGRVRKKQGQLG